MMKEMQINKIYGVLLMKKASRTGCALSRPVLLSQCAEQSCLRYQSPWPSGWPSWGLGQAEPRCHSRCSHLYAEQMILFSMFVP